MTKQFRDHEHLFQALRKALVAATAGGHTIDDFARNVTASLTESTAPSVVSTRQDALKHEVELVILRPQPNELLQGWRGRMAVTNGLRSVRDVDAALLDWVLRKSLAVGDDLDFVQCAASALGVTQQELIRHHTLIPYFDCLGNLKQNKPGHPGMHQRTYQRRAPLRVDGKSALFCPQCAAEDVGFRRFSYWRRSHHLPGVVWCSTHAVPLLVAGDHACFDRCPHHFLNDYIKKCAQPEGDAVKVILLRYARISEEILDLAPTIDSSAASSVFGKWAKEADLRISAAGKRKTLSTSLMDMLPYQWLEETFPRVHWQRNKYISTIDGVCTPRATRYTASTFCLLAAVFYDDADRAISELVDASADNREPSLGFDFWASREVFDLYCANNGVVSRMAKAMGMSPKSVSIGLLNQGLPGLGKSVQFRTALRAFFAGQSVENPCRAAGISQETLTATLRASGARLAKALDRMFEADLGKESAEDGAEVTDRRSQNRSARSLHRKKSPQTAM